ncbi:hypothetical protein [Streptococcus dysgalactiae]|uniref:Uncharacterized protein n=1 Tax=Streptococcus dysgalactiae subsp. equisimilis TaxID=119602 RepID=A0A9X8T1H6_STREQ|nr:hypothetical protein [Streptococcus dysgalactiae]HEP3126434.1 hypothetical protein [Streptococcus pyogenes]KKC22839.1 hypothetical protein WH79_04500 [Streptococcus dysgalactiae subsp. equisimilis]SQF68027.1 Uncharacterised protein [Streptococcus dysgalactiae subsp. equisimilis]VEF04889.1 Uncharacterised protein [Streptococcus dysgalactiae subsp. equisimilis]HEP3352364.1 hypothetical protein [Streptococcus pyogenes]
MEKDKKLDRHVTKSGYTYYTPRQIAPQAPQAPKENKWKKGVKWLGQALLASLKNLPNLLIKVAITPVFLLLFIINLVKSLIATAIGWFVFKAVVGFAVICYYAFLTKQGSAPVGVETWFRDWTFPHGVPIYHWWETTIILVLAIITALSLTFYSDEV